MMLLLLFIVVFVCSLYSFFYSYQKKDILNPLVLFYLPFLIQVVIHYFRYSVNFNISSKTYFIFFLGLSFFGLGYILFGLIIKENQYKAISNNVSSIYINKFVYNSMITVSYIGLILGLFQMYKFGRSGIAGAFLSSVRWHVNYGSGYNFITKYSVVPMQIICCYDILEKRTKKTLVYINIFVYLMLILIGMARTGIILSILALSYIWLLKNQTNLKNRISLSVKQRSYIISIFVAVVFIFIYIAKVTNKLYSNGDFFLYKYFGYPINAFNNYILNYPGITHGQKIGGTLYSILASMNFFSLNNIDNLLARIGEFNVYSYLSDPYLDFGTFGVVLVSFFLGIFLNYIYNKNLYFQGKWTIIYATLANSILISFYSYTYSLTYYIYIILFLIFFVKKRRNTL
ncbi:O-antigen polymerase [Streptococcus uberis]|uniref:O-antigen polymerase n=2 Tax=Streptococcus uberis TaxID=1349 RepID=UPI0020BEBF2B|nr:O-antigen polymerase [Streptococcus uberis]